MKSTTSTGVLAVLAGVLAGGPADAVGCPADSVKSGNLCVDKYEASVWRIPTSLPNDEELVAAVEAGTIASAADLAGAIRKGDNIDDYGAGCPDNGAGCKRFYAVSIPGVRPSHWINQIQATAACRNAGKRLLTNNEWTAAALGTPDPGTDNDTTDCNISNDPGLDPVNAGSRSLCVSDVGALDMVGNVWEWVADWVPLSTSCPGWRGGLSDDTMCLAGASTTVGPGALIRGGSFGNGTAAGPLAVSGFSWPSYSFAAIGFRCAREL